MQHVEVTIVISTSVDDEAFDISHILLHHLSTINAQHPGCIKAMDFDFMEVSK